VTATTRGPGEQTYGAYQSAEGVRSATPPDQQSRGHMPPQHGGGGLHKSSCSSAVCVCEITRLGGRREMKDVCVLVGTHKLRKRWFQLSLLMKCDENLVSKPLLSQMQLVPLRHGRRSAQGSNRGPPPSNHAPPQQQRHAHFAPEVGPPSGNDALTEFAHGSRGAANAGGGGGQCTSTHPDP
jgi:hypothetical protein